MADLDPFRAIVSTVNSSDTLTAIANSAGLVFDTQLTDRENYSHGTRIRALTPRILAAYDAAGHDHSVQIAEAAIATLARSTRDNFQRAIDAIAKIGWTWDGGSLVANDEAVKEKFFPKGSQWDAAVAIRGFLDEAQTELLVVDGYCDPSFFKLLSARKDLAKLKVRILCSQWPKQVANEAQLFAKQYKGVTVEVRSITGHFHDRFIVIDGKSAVHLGASIKDAGAKGFMVNAVENNANLTKLIQEIEASWTAATPA